MCQGSSGSLLRVEMKSGPQEATGRWSTEESLDGEGNLCWGSIALLDKEWRPAPGKPGDTK